MFVFFYPIPLHNIGSVFIVPSTNFFSPEKNQCTHRGKEENRRSRDVRPVLLRLKDDSNVETAFTQGKLRSTNPFARLVLNRVGDTTTRLSFKSIHFFVYKYIFFFTLGMWWHVTYAQTGSTNPLSSLTHATHHSQTHRGKTNST